VLIEHAHLNPASHYPRIFLEAAEGVSDSRLMLLAAGAAGYSAVRLVEAYERFKESARVEVLAAASGGIWVPFEVFELVRKARWHGAVLFVLNDRTGLLHRLVRFLVSRIPVAHAGVPRDAIGEEL
jgi:uncharacterized membrane protein (DUF2068 family)